ncbi:unnamed protein product [Ilex paraguariensis]|uniref:Protein BREAST CANCER SUSCEPTIBILITY 1 homolog n=1 Tax=Ilex paraguariensis TaxID=185542 RepID=A0ABC8V2H2_9AQUA
MDNLVCIYKSMEVASGVNIFVTQTAPSTKLSDMQAELFPHTFTILPAYVSILLANVGFSGLLAKNSEICSSSWNRSLLDTEASSYAGNPPESDGVCGSKETSVQENSRRSKGKGSKGSKKFLKVKRVQATDYPPPETPKHPKLDCGMDEIPKDGPKKSSVLLEEKHALNEKGDPVFSPFFWLREEEDVEKSSQQTDGDLIMETPPDAPCFSDIKESDDEAPCKMTPEKGTCTGPNDADIYDSEMFEWTQRACSPELFLSPMKVLVEATDENINVKKKCKSASQSSKANEESAIGNRKSRIPEMGNDNMETSLPTLSCPRTKSVAKSNKRVRKANGSTLKKRAKKNICEVIGISSDLQKVADYVIQEKTCDNNESSLNLVKTCKRNKKVGFDASATGSVAENSHTLCAGAIPLIQGDKTVVAHLSASSVQKEDSEGSKNLKKSGKINKTMDPQWRDRTRSKIQQLNTAKNIMQSKNIEVLTSQVLSKSPSISDDKENHDLGVKSRKVQRKNTSNLKCLKKVKFSMDSICKDKLAGGIATIRERVDAKEIQPFEGAQGNFDVKVINDSSKMQKVPSILNGVVLHKCETIPNKIQCAFCQSAEDSEVSGVMVHYFEGQPVGADYNGGLNITHAHRYCTEWAPNVYFEDDNAINLDTEVSRSRRIKCCCCGIKGAALGCYDKSCRKSFHVPCAKLTPECRWDNDNFVVLCPLHASLKLPNETSGSQVKHKKQSVRKRHSHIHHPQVTIKHDNSTCRKWKSQRPSEKLVLCCSALTDAEKETVSEFKRLSGVRVLKNWDSSVTHVIASTDENRACRRTLKFLMGVLEGKWILSIDWVKSCIKAEELVDEQHFEIDIDVHGIRGGPQLGRLRLSNQQPKLFNGYKFYFTGDFVPSYKGYLHDLVVAAGGTVLYRKPVSGDQEAAVSSGYSKSPVFIIYSLELQEKCAPSKRNLILSRRRTDAEELASSTGAIVASNSWVLNSVAACKLQNFAE